MDSYRQKMSVEGYEQKVPANVREQNLQKMQAAQKELEELQRALQGSGSDRIGPDRIGKTRRGRYEDFPTS